MKNQRIDINSIFYPQTIAVIGASREPGSVGNSLLSNLIDSRFNGIVYPVNPKARGILGIKCHPSVLDISDQIDLAVVLVPAPFVPQVLEECGKKGVKGAIVISAGFKEIGGKGMNLELQVQNIIREYGIALVGPNCLGVINAESEVRMNATFGTQIPPEGNIAFISQSGALCVAVLEYARQSNIGFSKFISMGNKAGLNENDLLRYLADDPKTDVILMYLEDLVDGREFMAIARSITSHSRKPKPIIALKAGRTLIGAKAASSHTGSLAGSDKIYDAIFEQCGVIRGDTLDQVSDYIKGFAHQPLPAGNQVAIITNSGGPGILATDSCIQNGLSIQDFPTEVKKALRRTLPASIAIHNPIDLIAEAQAEQYENSLREILQHPEIHSAIVILTPTAFTRADLIAKSIVKITQQIGKPVLCCFLGVYDVSRGLDILEGNGVPTYRFPESAARTLAQMTKFKKWIRRRKTGVKTYAVQAREAAEVYSQAKQSQRTFLMEHEAYRVLQAYGFPVIPHHLAHSGDEAAESAQAIGYPVVLKIASPNIVHKFDIGGVKLNLENEEEVRGAFQEITDSVRQNLPDAEIAGIIVEKMMTGGKEVILGMNRDPQFGPLLMFGMGGIYVEVLQDVSFRLAPIRSMTARRMIEKTRTHKILKGYRGEPPYDIEAIEECLKRLSQLVMEQPWIEELDINPMMVFQKGNGCLVVDARIIIQSLPI